MYFGVELEGEKPYNELELGECVHMKLYESTHFSLKPSALPHVTDLKC